MRCGCGSAAAPTQHTRDTTTILTLTLRLLSWLTTPPPRALSARPAARQDERDPSQAKPSRPPGFPGASLSRSLAPHARARSVGVAAASAFTCIRGGLAWPWSTSSNLTIGGRASERDRAGGGDVTSRRRAGGWVTSITSVDHPPAHLPRGSLEPMHDHHARPTPPPPLPRRSAP